MNGESVFSGVQNEYRCKKCGKLLFKFKNSVIIDLEIKCDRCGTVNEIKNAPAELDIMA